jgi:predicted RNA-binding Zn ribbon-like protein
VTNHLVEGRPMPDHIAGHPALELCNTKALWDLPTEHEYLTDFTAAVIWAGEHRIVTADEARRLRSEPDSQQRTALGRLRGLRRAVYQAVTIPSAPLEPVHGFVAGAVTRSAYDPHGRLVAPYTPGVITDRCALEAHRMFEEYGRGAVGLCASEACGWVFLDPTHRRRWCVMAVCGNRAKARRHAARRRLSR